MSMALHPIVVEPRSYLERRSHAMLNKKQRLDGIHRLDEPMYLWRTTFLRNLVAKQTLGVLGRHRRRTYRGECVMRRRCARRWSPQQVAWAQWAQSRHSSLRVWRSAPRHGVLGGDGRVSALWVIHQGHARVVQPHQSRPLSAAAGKRIVAGLVGSAIDEPALSHPHSMTVQRAVSSTARTPC